MNRNARRAEEALGQRAQGVSMSSAVREKGIPGLSYNVVSINKQIPSLSTGYSEVKLQASGVESGSISEYTASSLFDFQEDLLKMINSIESKIDALSDKFSAFEKAFSPNELSAGVCTLREGVSDADLKNEIKQYFVDHDGETVYPSDVSSSLNIDYDLATRLIYEMEENGQIRSA